MRCYICNAILNEPKMNPDIGNYDPCDTCMSIIEDTVAGFTDKPAADEDAFTTADPLIGPNVHVVAWPEEDF